MTFADPAKVARAVVRHVRNSHAIGKLVLDTALQRFSGKAHGAASDVGERSTDVASGFDVVPGGGDKPASYDGLPLPVAEWALLRSGEVVDMIERCDDEAVRAIGAYEEVHRRRRLVVQAVKNRLTR